MDKKNISHTILPTHFFAWIKSLFHIYLFKGKVPSFDQISLSAPLKAFEKCFHKKNIYFQKKNQNCLLYSKK